MSEKINYFESDDIGSVYNELVAVETAIEQSGQEIKRLANDWATKQSHYENLKNKFLIQMFDEENAEGSKIKKRTEAQRQSLYRVQYATERLEVHLAKNAWEAEKKYHDGLQTVASSIMARKNVLMPKN